MVDGLAITVLPIRTTCRPPHPAPASPARAAHRVLAGVVAGHVRQRLAPRGPQRVDALRQACAGFEHLPGRGGLADPDGIAIPKLKPVDAGLLRQLVQQRLVHDGRLRDAEAAEGAGDRPLV